MDTALLDLYCSWFVGTVSDYALQTDDGGYYRVGSPLTYDTLEAHLAGRLTIGTYVIETDESCRFVVFDDDTPDGLSRLLALSEQLAALGIHAYVESSRRGAHAWVPFSAPLPAWAARAWLLPYCPSGVEFYPKQDTRGNGYGSLIRLPLGVHRRSGERYPFVTRSDGTLVALPDDLSSVLSWLSQTGATLVPDLSALAVSSPRRAADPFHQNPQRATPREKSQSKNVRSVQSPYRYQNAGDWCAAQESYALISRYVRLDGRGMGHCPFTGHHQHGADRRPSFRAYHPSTPGGWCWFCYTWNAGGSVFDFLRYYHGLDARTLWARLQAGEQF